MLCSDCARESGVGETSSLGVGSVAIKALLPNSILGKKIQLPGWLLSVFKRAKKRAFQKSTRGGKFLLNLYLAWYARKIAEQPAPNSNSRGIALDKGVEAVSKFAERVPRNPAASDMRTMMRQGEKAVEEAMAPWLLASSTSGTGGGGIDLGPWQKLVDELDVGRTDTRDELVGVPETPRELRRATSWRGGQNGGGGGGGNGGQNGGAGGKGGRNGDRVAGGLRRATTWRGGQNGGAGGKRPMSAPAPARAPAHAPARANGGRVSGGLPRAASANTQVKPQKNGGAAAGGWKKKAEWMLDGKHDTADAGNMLLDIAQGVAGLFS